MSCSELEATIAELPLGTLAPDEKARLDEHSATCAKCRALITRLEAAYVRLDEALAPDEPLPAGLRERIVTAAKAAAGAACASCGTTVEEPDAAFFGPERAPYHVECLAKTRVESPRAGRPAMGCTFCHDRLTRDGAAFCATCLAPHHEECFREHGRCAAPGCGESRVVRPATPSRPRRVRWPLLLLAGGGLAALGTAALTTRAGTGATGRIETSLREGASALGERHFDVALAHYEAALIIDPRNDEARRGAERCRTALALEAAKIPKPSSTAREVPALLGKSRAEVVSALGTPTSDETTPEDKTKDGKTKRGWRKLFYRNPSATVYLDPVDDQVVHAVLDEGWSFRGVQIGMRRAAVVSLLGVPEKDQLDLNGGHHVVYTEYGLALPFDGPDETISTLVFTRNPEFHADLSGGMTAPVPPEPKPRSTLHEVSSLVGQSKAQVVALLGPPTSEETIPDEKRSGYTVKRGWIKLAYRKPTATIYLDPAEDRVVLATLYSDWSYRGVHVGMHRTEVMDLLGEPDNDTRDTSGGHHFTYKSCALALPFDGPGETVSTLVLEENPCFVSDVNGNVSTPMRPPEQSVKDPEPPTPRK